MARVLVIDDDPDIRDLIGYVLAAAGHEVTHESDGRAGLDRARQLRPDVLILDWTLPGLDGVQVCAGVRADPALAATRVILLSARARPADIAAGLAAGAHEYLTKPFHPRELADRVAAP